MIIKCRRGLARPTGRPGPDYCTTNSCGYHIHILLLSRTAVAAFCAQVWLTCVHAVRPGIGSWVSVEARGVFSPFGSGIFSASAATMRCVVYISLPDMNTSRSILRLSERF